MIAQALQHLEFMRWADGKLLSSVANDVDVFSILNHIYRGEVTWLRRVQGEAGAKISDVASAGDLRELRELWPEVHRQWVEWGREQMDWELPVPHEDSRGNWYEMPVWQIVMHVVNHGSYHRGQAILLLRKAGVNPPSTDLIAFYRNPV